MKAVINILLNVSVYLTLLLLSNNVYAQFPENFDGVTVPNLPTQWTTEVVPNVSANLWKTVNNFSNSAPNSAFVNDPTGTSDSRLISPTFFYTGGQLVFLNRYSMDSNFDGGVLEISINGGAFTDILAAGGSFSAGGYTSNMVGGVLSGRQAWSGSTGGAFVVTIVNLPASATNKNVILRWRRGTDSIVSGQGWWVDSITLPVKTDLVITKTDSADPFIGGTHLSYTISVTNNGPNIATQVDALDAYPSGTSPDTTQSTISQGTFDFNFSSKLVTAKFGTMPVGATASATINMFTSTVIPNPAVLTVSAPNSIARDFQVLSQPFGSDPAFPGVSGSVARVTDSGGIANDACEFITNQNQIQNNIALVNYSGLCPADEAAARAQSAGAIAVVIVSNTLGFGSLTTSGINVAIPVGEITSLDGNEIINVITGGGGPVLATYGSLTSQLLNTARAQSATSLINTTDDIAFQYTSFLNDTDTDGIPDVQDNCPQVNSTNQTDTDGDGIGDLCDTCTDTDRDGFGNPEFVVNTCTSDGCPLDGSKKVPGVCGCGVSDANDDGDSKPNCQESCPNDGNKTVPGICGCGTPDTDTNGNGIIDCLKTPELKSLLATLKSQLKSITLIPTDKRKASKQKKIRKNIKSLLADIQNLISGGNIALINNNSTVDELSKSLSSAVNKASKTKTAKFGKNKKSALKVLDSFSSNLNA